jgi:hypothetical protein
MNIFATSSCPIESAKALDDKRVIKMILESAQLLSSAIWLNGGKGPYRLTHANHPCTIWVRTSKANYNWLLTHYKALLNEYTNRYSKTHKCASLLTTLTEGANYLPNDTLNPFVNCTSYKELDIHTAYKLYLNDKWDSAKRSPTWYQVAR